MLNLTQPKACLATLWSFVLNLCPSQLCSFHLICCCTDRQFDVHFCWCLVMSCTNILLCNQFQTFVGFVCHFSVFEGHGKCDYFDNLYTQFVTNKSRNFLRVVKDCNFVNKLFKLYLVQSFCVHVAFFNCSSFTLSWSVAICLLA